MSISRLMLPIINDHKADFQKYAQSLLDRPVAIRQVEASWYGFTPVIRFKGVDIYDPAHKKILLHVKRFEIGFNVLKSLLNWKVVPSLFSLSGAAVEVQQDQNNKIHVVGFENPNPDRDKSKGQQLKVQKVISLLLSQEHIVLHNIDVDWQPKGGKIYPLLLKFIDVDNESPEHIITGQLNVYKSKSSQLSFRLGVQGDWHKPLELDTKIYLQGKNISLASLLAKNDRFGLHFANGNANFQLWSEIKSKKLQFIQTQFSLQKIQLKSLVTKQSFGFDNVGGSLAWDRNQSGGWNFTGNNIRVSKSADTWPVANFSLVLNKASKQASLERTLVVDRLQLADVESMMLGTNLVSEKLRDRLQAMQVKGHIEHAYLHDKGKLNDFANTQASAEFVNLGVNKSSSAPGISNISGKMVWDGKLGKLTLNSQQTQLELGRKFIKPFKFDHVSGHVYFDQNAQGIWQLHSDDLLFENNELALVPKLALTFGKSPEIALLAGISLNKVSDITNYLPIGGFKPGLKRWLSQAFTTGRLEATAVINGPLKDFPFKKKQGAFVVGGDIHNVNLHYADGWPNITNLGGRVFYNGDEITVGSRTGKILGVHINNVEAHIALKDKTKKSGIEVIGQLYGDSSQGMLFVNKSPLVKTLGKSFKQFTLAGPMDLNLKLRIPTSSKAFKTQVDGRMLLRDNELTLPNWNVSMSKVSGRVNFGVYGVTTPSSTPISGELFGHPASITLATNILPAGKETVVGLNGFFPANEMAQRLKAPYNRFISGSAQFNAKAIFPGSALKKKSSLVFTSDMRGITVDLPKPLYKAPDVAAPTTLKFNFASNSPVQLNGNYNNQIKALLQWGKNSAGKQTIEKGDIHVGKGAPVLPKNDGLVINGSISSADWSDWRQAIKRFKTHSDGGSRSLLKSVNLNIDKLLIYKQLLSPATVGVDFKPDGYNVKLNSKKIIGNLFVPKAFPSKPLKGDFSRLHIAFPKQSKSGKTSSKPLQPSDIPSMDVTAKDFSFAGKNLGVASVGVVDTEKGLDIKRLTLASSKLNATISKGSWKIVNGKSQTQLQGVANSADLSGLFKLLGIKSNFLAKAAAIKFNLTWNDSPFKISVPTLSGQAGISVGAGVLTNLGKQATSSLAKGKLISLLSLDSLGNRFDELSNEGYSFNSLSGSFNLDDGNLFIDKSDNIKLNGTVADIDVKGLVGLAAQNYDLRISITPKATSSLPVLIGIIGGPIALGVAWLTNKVASPIINNVTRLDYTMTGSWQYPTFKKVSSSAGSK